MLYKQARNLVFGVYNVCQEAEARDPFCDAKDNNKADMRGGDILHILRKSGCFIVSDVGCYVIRKLLDSISDILPIFIHQ
jgi:hypothetical protein